MSEKKPKKNEKEENDYRYKRPEEVALILEIKDERKGYQDSPIRVAWADLNGEPGIDIRRFWPVKEEGQRVTKVIPTHKKGIRLPPEIFLKIISLHENKTFMKELLGAIDNRKLEPSQ